MRVRFIECNLSGGGSLVIKKGRKKEVTNILLLIQFDLFFNYIYLQRLINIKE